MWDSPCRQCQPRCCCRFRVCRGGRCCCGLLRDVRTHWLRLLLLEVDGLGVGVPLELVLLAVLWE